MSVLPFRYSRTLSRFPALAARRKLALPSVWKHTQTHTTSILHPCNGKSHLGSWLMLGVHCFNVKGWWLQSRALWLWNVCLSKWLCVTMWESMCVFLCVLLLSGYCTHIWQLWKYEMWDQTQEKLCTMWNLKFISMNMKKKNTIFAWCEQNHIKVYCSWKLLIPSWCGQMHFTSQWNTCLWTSRMNKPHKQKHEV